jgi:poly(3-hydroxybutyrate) depolymerase
LSASLLAGTALACGGSSPPSDSARDGNAGAAGTSASSGGQQQTSAGKSSGAGGDTSSGSAGKAGSGGSAGKTGSGGSAGKTGSGGSAGSSMGTGGSAGSSTGAGGVPEPSSGCDAPSTLTEGNHPLTSGGVERHYYLVPAKTKDPVPLIIGFHGYGGNGGSMLNLFGQEALSGGKAVFIYPDGVPQAWYQNATGWDQRSATTPDTIFIKDLIDDALKEHCIDATRVYAVGFSWGGYMSNHVGCALGDRIRATASFAGGASDTKNCTGPASALFAHGTADQSELISEGKKARDEWLKLNSCGATTSSVAGGKCVAYAGCTSPVWWCEHGGGHQVPTDLQPVVWDFLQNSP